MLFDYFFDCMNFATDKCSGDCDTCKNFDTPLRSKLKEASELELLLDAFGSLDEERDEIRERARGIRESWIS